LRGTPLLPCTAATTGDSPIWGSRPWKEREERNAPAAERWVETWFSEFLTATSSPVPFSLPSSPSLLVPLFPMYFPVTTEKCASSSSSCVCFVLFFVFCFLFFVFCFFVFFLFFFKYLNDSARGQGSENSREKKRKEKKERKRRHLV